MLILLVGEETDALVPINNADANENIDDRRKLMAKVDDVGNSVGKNMDLVPKTKRGKLATSSLTFRLIGSTQNTPNTFVENRLIRVARVRQACPISGV